MLLYLLLCLLLLAMALYLIRGRSHSQQHSEVSQLDAEQDLMQSSVVFGNISGQVETPNSSEVFNELVTIQSSLGDDHSLLLRRSKQRSLLSRLKLSTFKSKKAEWSQASKATQERSMAEVSSLGESVTSVTAQVTQIPAPVGQGEKAADRSKSLKLPPAETSLSSEADVTQIPAVAHRSDEESPTQLETTVVKLEKTVIEPETTVAKPLPLPLARTEVVPPTQPFLPSHQTTPPKKGRQPIPWPQKHLEMVNESPSDQQGHSKQDRKTTPQLRTKSKVSEQMLKRTPKERKKLGKKSKVQPRLRIKPSTMLSVGVTDLWTDPTRAGTSKLPEAGSDVESETQVTQLEVPQSPKFNEEQTELPQLSKAKSRAEGKRKVKDSARPAKSGSGLCQVSIFTKKSSFMYSFCKERGRS